jgi:hypothetical protein
VAMHGPDEDDVVEQGGPPLRLPGWARRPRWLPAAGGDDLFGLAQTGGRPNRHRTAGGVP